MPTFGMGMGPRPPGQGKGEGKGKGKGKGVSPNQIPVAPKSGKGLADPSQWQIVGRGRKGGVTLTGAMAPGRVVPSAKA